MIRAVFFDVGETLVDETRQWASWAEWMGVPVLTFCAVLGAVIERGEHHRRVFEYLAPGFDLPRAMAERAAAGSGYVIERRDFYPDALPTLEALRAAGLIVGIVGNQPEETEAALADSGVVVDHIASSARWGVEKPSPAFFQRIVDLTSLSPGEIAYVGDRLDNDVLPAAAAGMKAILVVRGPWGVLHAQRPEAAQAHAVIHDLSDLPAVITDLNRCG